MTNNDDTSTVEKIAGEATAKVPAKPKGSPTLAPLTQLRRRRRAEFRAALTKGISPELAKRIQGGGNIEDVDEAELLGTEGLLDYAVHYLANIEDALAVVALDRDAFDEWAAKCSDEDLEGLFAWYSAKYPTGEA